MKREKKNRDGCSRHCITATEKNFFSWRSFGSCGLIDCIDALLLFGDVLPQLSMHVIMFLDSMSYARSEMLLPIRTRMVSGLIP